MNSITTIIVEHKAYCEFKIGTFYDNYRAGHVDNNLALHAYEDFGDFSNDNIFGV